MVAISHLFVKCVGTLGLFIVTVICGILPIKIIRSAKSQSQIGKKRRRRQLFIGCCNCFAGGVFFSVCLLDLIPLVKDKITDALHEVNIYTKFPLGEAIAGIGFILMLVTEIVVHSMKKDSILMDHSHRHNQLDEEEDAPLLYDDNHQDYESRDNGFVASSKTYNCDGDDTISPPIGPEVIVNSPRELPDGMSEDSRPNSPVMDHTVSHVPRLRRTRSLRSIASINTVVHSSFRMYILIMALSLHSLFEGLTVGLITDAGTLVQLLVALLLHKGVIAFALGVKLVDGGLKGKAVIIGIILFAAMAPLGVGLGILVLESFSRVTSLFFSGTLQGLATGSFLYVTFFEILPEEFTIDSGNKGAKVISVIFGFLIISGMCYYENRFHHNVKKVIPCITPTAKGLFITPPF